ncbi:MAG: bifunctional phosphoglucose/phosphomannose isomerase [Candidatus Niyogibacteria bacterium]|nr:bifunctional phosphoglucose/phosphomannose isomerase [Candidatus Niyogibacteria bacterium]
MAMDATIKDFPKQFEYEPHIENADRLEKKKHIIIAGMGGSALPGDIAKMAFPFLDIAIHRDYGLPYRSDSKLKESLCVAISYSGNTEEVLDAFDAAEQKNLSTAIIATGGELLERAKEKGVAHVKIPNTGIQPRMGTGFMLQALMKLLGMENALVETKTLVEALDVDTAEKEGKTLAEKIRGKVPIIYSSVENKVIAYNWKVKFNETGKIPAFYNVFPELNHNEMTGFDIKEPTKKIGEMFHFIFLRDRDDHPKIQKRMDICKKLYEDRGLHVETMALEGATLWEKIFFSFLIADWASFYTSTHLGLDPEQVPMVAEFKKMI